MIRKRAGGEPDRMENASGENDRRNSQGNREGEPCQQRAGRAMAALAVTLVLAATPGRVASRHRLRAVLGAQDERTIDVIDGAHRLGGRDAQHAGKEVAQNGSDSQPAHHACTVATAPHGTDGTDSGFDRQLGTMAQLPWASSIRLGRVLPVTGRPYSIRGYAELRLGPG